MPTSVGIHYRPHVEIPRTRIRRVPNQPVRINLVEATITISPQTLTVTLAPLVINLVPATITLEPQVLVVDATQPVEITLVAATITLTPSTLTVTVAPLVINLTPAQIELQPQILDPQVAVFPIEVTLTPAIITVEAIAHCHIEVGRRRIGPDRTLRRRPMKFPPSFHN